MLDSSILTGELKLLMKEIEQLREGTEAISCNCSNPDCPFNTARRDAENDSERGENSPDLGFGSMEVINDRFNHSVTESCGSLPLSLLTTPLNSRHLLSRNSTSLTNIPRGIQKRADGTIVEHDYPWSHTGEKRRSSLYSNFSTKHLNVIVADSMEEDCRVDQDGVTSNEDYKFTREAPERKIITRSSKAGKRKSIYEYLPSFQGINNHVRSKPQMSRYSSAGVILQCSTRDELTEFVQMNRNRHSCAA